MKYSYSVYVYLAFVALLAVLAFLIIRPYGAALLLGAIFSYWIYPLHVKLSTKIKNTPSALILSATLFVVLASFLQYTLYLLITEMAHMSAALQSTHVNEIVTTFLGRELISGITAHAIVDKVISQFLSEVSRWIYSAPEVIISFFIFTLSVFYFLKDGKRIVNWIKQNIPFPKKHRSRLISSSKEYIDAFLKAQLIIGLVQGVVCAFGLFLFGLKDYMLVGGLIAALLSILPIIGPYLLYIPISAILLASGQIFNGMGLLIYGLGIGSFLDYVIRPQITANYSKMHPLIVLIGVVGGMYVFGLIGMFIGPVVLGIAVTIIENIGKGSFLPDEEIEE